ncbi:MAG: hypothetical protein U0104_08545 [Gemmatimonadales bacterium]|nr:hypothetical protein [Gemmatimonadales bacterium]
MRQKLIGAAVLAALFLSGIAVGMATDRYLHRPSFRRDPGGEHGGPVPSPEMRDRMVGMIVGRLRRELDLSSDQARQLREMLPRHIAALDSVRALIEPQVEAVAERSAAEVAAILTPAQREVWNQRWRRMGIPGGPPGMPPGDDRRRDGPRP